MKSSPLFSVPTYAGSFSVVLPYVLSYNTPFSRCRYQPFLSLTIFTTARDFTLVEQKHTPHDSSVPAHDPVLGPNQTFSYSLLTTVLLLALDRSHCVSNIFSESFITIVHSARSPVFSQFYQHGRNIRSLNCTSHSSSTENCNQSITNLCSLDLLHFRITAHHGSFLSNTIFQSTQVSSWKHIWNRFSNTIQHCSSHFCGRPHNCATYFNGLPVTDPSNVFISL